MGRIAQNYDLYTKITGVSRIDIFGAQLHELPLIVGETVLKGFETGQATVKIVTTVKVVWAQHG